MRSKSQPDCESILEIVFSSVPEDNRRISMFSTCYLDDSKDKNQSILYVCAGFVASDGHWKEFDKKWDKQLKAEGIAYYKSSEFRSLTGEFLQFKQFPHPEGRNKAIAVVERLKNIIATQSGFTPVGAIVPVDDHRLVMSHAGADIVFGERGIYNRAFEGSLLKSAEISCRSKRDRIAFVHDDGPDFDQLRAIYMSYIKVNPISGKHMRGFIPLDDKTTPGLQAADLFANNLQNCTGRQLKDGNVEESEVFQFKKLKVVIWLQEFGEIILAANLKRRNLPIPESLNHVLHHTENAMKDDWSHSYNSLVKRLRRKPKAKA